MKTYLHAALAVLCLSAACLVVAKDGKPVAAPAAVDGGISVYFSPKGGCSDAIIEQIDAARTSIDVQAYYLTSTSIAKSLADAQGRGVKVRAILDKKASGTKYSGATFLFNHGIETYTDGKHAIAHNKIMLIDGKTIITGSFNFTKAAEESNAENVLIITGKPKLVEAYRKNFDDHLAHSERYEGIKEGQ